jgi:hypothetical protein
MTASGFRQVGVTETTSYIWRKLNANAALGRVLRSPKNTSYGDSNPDSPCENSYLGREGMRALGSYRDGQLDGNNCCLGTADYTQRRYTGTPIRYLL